MELFRALAVLIERPDPAHAGVAQALGLPPLPAAADHTEVIAFQCWPYASVMLGAEGQMGGEARDRIAGFWRALGETPPTEPDHLTILLAACAEVSARAGDDPRWAPAHATLLHEHLASWLPIWLDAVVELEYPFYTAWARLLAGALREAWEAVPAPPDMPLHLRNAAGLPEGDEQDALVDALLAPVRSGLVLTRHTLTQAAGMTGLAPRVAERHYAFSQLLAQDARATWRWLAQRAEARTARYGEPGFAPPLVAQFWRERALATAERARGLAGD